MPGLIRQGCRPRGERGAVAALVVVLLGTGALLGSGALVLDVGQAYAERAQLQNGADSAALAVAAVCSGAASACNGSTAAGGVAGNHAAANANDRAVTVTSVCGYDLTGALSRSCPTPSGQPFDCGPKPTSGTTYVEVRTQTLTTSGSSFLSPAFGRAVMGPSYPGMTVAACSRAVWGAPASASGLGLTISYCEWQSYIGGNPAAPAYADPPPAIPPTSAEHVIYFHHTSPSPTHCTAGPSGADVPGDFGSTSTASNTCSTLFNFVAANGPVTYGADPGSSLSSECQTALSTARNARAVAFLPIYVKVSGNGANGTYTMWNMAAFVVTGYYWPNFRANSWLTGAQPCKGSARCISGYFTTAVVPGAVVGAPAGAGASAVQMSN